MRLALFMRKRILVLFIFCAVACVAVWAVIRFTEARRHRAESSLDASSNSTNQNIDAWAQAVEKVKAPRSEAEAGPAETPPELRHYSERYWFLATQVAEIEKQKVYL